MSTTTPAPIPKTMHGILLPRTGPASILEYKDDLPVPAPKANEVLVRNTHIGINYIDTYFRSGLYPSEKPEILGREGAGEVVAVGTNANETGEGQGNGGFKVGDRVTWMGTSGYAQYTSAPTKNTLKIPDAISNENAAAALLQGLTALSLVEEAHKVISGDWILVLAATGGVGGWLLQILRAKGAHTVAVVGSQGKVEEARRLGAEVVVVEEEGKVEEVVREKTGGEGVRAVFDGVGKVTFERSLGVVGRKGTVVSFGNASGAVEPFSISKLSAKNAKVVRPTLYNYIYTREEYEKYADELFRLMIEEKFDVRIHKTYPLKDATQAHEDIESRKTMGKLLLSP